MGDDITIGVTEIVNNIEVTAQPNDQIVDISVIDNADDVTLNITPTVIEINVNKGSSYAKWGTILGTLSDQTDLQDALDLKADLVDGKVPSSQLPSYVDDVIEVANYAALPVTGETGKIYITLDNNHIFRWTGSIYVEITDNTAVWGAITGTLSSQTDLQNALNAKVPYTGATANVNLGEYGIKGGYLALDTTPTSTPTGIGTIYWDSANRTAALIDGDGDTMLQIGQEQRILVHNNTGSTLTDGQIVYVTGSTGELPSVSLANASSETTSGATIGMITESIANGADGFVTTSGIVHGLNTLAFNEGDLLWLGTTAGTYTATKPTSPNHLVLIGYVIKKAGGNGSILVKIQNTQELDECSDVLFSGLTNNDLLVYETASSLWKNKSLSTLLGYTPANDANVVHKTGDETITGLKTFSSDLNVSDLYVNGYSGFSGRLSLKQANSAAFSGIGYTTVNALGTSALSINFRQADGTNKTMQINANLIGAAVRVFQFPDADGTVALTSQLHNAVTLGTANGLSLSTQVLSLGLASASTNGALSSTDWNTFNNKQNALTNPITGTGTANYLSKFTGSGTLGNSLIYEIGSTIGIGTTSPFSALHISRNASELLRITRGSVSDFSFDLGASNDLYINNNGVGTTPLTILGSGNVGIGTMSPNSYGAGYVGLTLDGSTTSFITARANGVNKITLSANGGGGTPVIQANDATTALGFQVGGSERMRITSGGNVGIGTTSPSYILQTKAGSGFVGAAFSSSYAATSIIGNDANSSWFGQGTNGLSSAYVINNTSGYAQIELGGSPRFYVNSSGNVGIGTTSPSYQLQLSTDSAAKPTSALWTIASDERIKENINSYTKGLNELLKINPITYDYNGLGGFKKGKGGVGIIAQEIAEILPDSVSSIKGKLNETDEEEIDILNFNGHELTYILINAVKELKAEIEILKNK